MNNCLGRLPREFNPAVPHMSTLRMMRRVALPSIPAQIDYISKLPQDLGMMGNDRLGDCTAAACYHARQVWTMCAKGQEATEADQTVVEWYSENSGYDPASGTNDNGAVEQTVLQNWLTTGLPTASGRQRLLGYVEIDPRNLRDVRRAIYECGLVYIGFNVPSDINESPGGLWDVGTGSIVGGHAVILPGYDSSTLDVVSWGTRYKMTERFWASYVDEAYALISEDWITTTGMTLLGLSADALLDQMKSLRE